MAFGHIEGYPVGSTFEGRQELHDAGVHRPMQAGICGSEKHGAESIVLSGGYEDDYDLGDEILYTGEGGRDSKTKRQVAHQQLGGRNLALVTSMNRGLPVRVIRGPSEHVYDAPQRGYRYDGLYRVEAYLPKVGKSGYRVYQFRLASLEEASANRVLEERGRYKPAPRRAERVQRIVRSTVVAESVKKLHGYRCQVCGERLGTPGGCYAEAAHIRPLGRPHNGPDAAANVLCLCPNHHALFDYYGFAVGEGFELIGLGGHLRTHSRHRIDPAHLQYHRDLFFAASDDA